jgi:hypothetical protein
MDNADQAVTDPFGAGRDVVLFEIQGLQPL